MSVQPIYERLERTRDQDDLWNKLRGDWEWLGDLDGQALVGTPRRSGVFSASASATVLRAGAKEGEHGVSVAGPRGAPSYEWCLSEEAAKEAFSRTLDQLRDTVGLFQVQRIEMGNPVVTERVGRLPQIRELLDTTALTFLGVLVGIALAFGFGFATITWWAGLVAAVGSSGLLIVSLPISLGQPSVASVVRVGVGPYGPLARPRTPPGFPC